MHPSLLYGSRRSPRQLSYRYSDRLDYFAFLNLLKENSLPLPWYKEFPEARFVEPTSETDDCLIANLIGLIEGRRLIITLSLKEKNILLDYQLSLNRTENHLELENPSTNPLPLFRSLARIISEPVNLEVRSSLPKTLERLLVDCPPGWNLGKDERDTLTAFGQLAMLSPNDRQSLMEVSDLASLSERQRHALLNANQFIPLYLSRPLIELR